MKDNKFEYWKAKLLNHVDGLIKKEEKPVKKSFSDYVDYILKSAGRGHLVPKKILQQIQRQEKLIQLRYM
jgi:hypothetical protein